MPRTLASARSNYGLSALIARRAVREATKVRGGGSAAVWSVVAAHQIANARSSETAVAEMLAEQEIAAQADALLNALTYTTGPTELGGMLEQVDTDAEFARL